MEALYFLNPWLRVIHIVAAGLWVGIGFAAAVMIIPAQQIAGTAGITFTRALYGQTPYGRIFAILGGATVLAGLLLYATGSHTHFSNLGNAVLGIGAVAGFAAAGHGGAAVGKQSEQYHQAALAVEGDAKNETLMQEVGAKLKRSAMTSLIMMLVALVLMSSARYL
jgi:hypothetical protein